MSYIIIIFLILKVSNIARGKSKQIKFPNLWLMPMLFIFMIIEDLSKGYSIISFLVIPILSIFAALGFLVGWIRGKSLSYQKDRDSGEVYYQESYLSIIIYGIVIVVKLALNLLGGASLSFISTGIIIFTCASMIGRCGNISYNYLKVR